MLGATCCFGLCVLPHSFKRLLDLSVVARSLLPSMKPFRLGEGYLMLEMAKRTVPASPEILGHAKSLIHGFTSFNDSPLSLPAMASLGTTLTRFDLLSPSSIVLETHWRYNN